MDPLASSARAGRRAAAVTAGCAGRAAAAQRGRAAYAERVTSPEQAAVCARLGVDPVAPGRGSKTGLAVQTNEAGWPLTGIRHLPTSDTNGWYVWWGEQRSDDPDFFDAMHVEHLADWCPEALPYLALPPGWAFVIAPDYEDVWFDKDFVVE
jgi:hypothetical protein